MKSKKEKIEFLAKKSIECFDRNIGLDEYFTMSQAVAVTLRDHIVEDLKYAEVSTDEIMSFLDEKNE